MKLSLYSFEAYGSPASYDFRNTMGVGTFSSETPSFYLSGRNGVRLYRTPAHASCHQNAVINHIRSSHFIMSDGGSR